MPKKETRKTTNGRAVLRVGEYERTDRPGYVFKWRDDEDTEGAKRRRIRHKAKRTGENSPKGEQRENKSATELAVYIIYNIYNIYKNI